MNEGFKFILLYFLLLAIFSLIGYNCGGFKDADNSQSCNDVKHDTVYIIIEK